MTPNGCDMEGGLTDAIRMIGWDGFLGDETMDGRGVVFLGVGEDSVPFRFRCWHGHSIGEYETFLTSLCGGRVEEVVRCDNENRSLSQRLRFLTFLTYPENRR